MMARAVATRPQFGLHDPLRQWRPARGGEKVCRERDRGTEPAFEKHRAQLSRSAFLMVNSQLTMMKNSLPAWFLSHCQGDRMKSGRLIGAALGGSRGSELSAFPALPAD